MKDSERNTGTRSVTIGGAAHGNIIQTGDNNSAVLHYEKVSLPAPEEIEIQQEFTALREILLHLATGDRKKIEHALDDAEEELNKPAPDKDEVGDALERALKYSKKVEEFTIVSEKVKPHLTRAISWLGENWHKLLSIVGCTV